MPANKQEKIDCKRIGYGRTGWILLTSYAPVVAMMWFLASIKASHDNFQKRYPLNLAAGGLTRMTFVSHRDERLAVRVTQKDAMRPPQIPQSYSVVSCQITEDGNPVPLARIMIGKPSPPKSGRLDLAEFDAKKGVAYTVEATTLQTLFPYAVHNPQLRIVSHDVQDEPSLGLQLFTTFVLMTFCYIALAIFLGRMRAAQRRIGSV